ncbi:serine hydrolase [Streptomyces atratus]|uniref:serine hydrolase n=1 Tax=Streptomyces atratus TaxID=1893 RepID=UPI0022568636|nr:serine hydrolase [Streptomyces atratus]MCX5344681.1 class A beta-lactamase-related serine hydrolase [Streptomyces atratus]
MTRNRFRGSALSASVTAVLLLAGSAAGGICLAGPSSDHAPRASASVSSVPAAGSTPVPATTSEEPTVDLDAALAAAVEPLLTDVGDAEVSVAVLDTGSGARAVYGDGAYDTASIVKVDILAALLLRTQDEKRALTAGERGWATAMIEWSDNASATALLRAIGGAEALDAANERLGLTGTTAAHAWGLTQTTASDQLALLKAVFGTESELSEGSRTYLQGLMGQVAADQQWGVSAAGSRWALKNGWMPRTTTGLWDINSIGRVSADGRTYLLAVLSGGQRTKETGIALVESVAKAAVGVLDAAR